MTDFKELIASCENEIRAGQSQKVAGLLTGLERSEVPLAFRLPLANLCRRVGLIGQGLKYLAPIIQADRDGASAASHGELAEYAALLQREGALHEALLLLARVDTREVPDASLFKAFCHFARWEYSAAIPYLREFLTAPVAPYMRLVGEANLASALIATGEHEEALSILSSLVSAARAGQFNRLLANCLEMRAQIWLRRSDFAAAKADLDAGTELASREKTLDLFLIQKWTAVLELLQKRDAKGLQTFRRRAVEADDWESVRESDLYLLKAEFDHAKFEHLYFGTPFAGYRAKIERELGRTPTTESFILGSRKGPRIEIERGLVDGEDSLRFGGKTHRVLQILTRDFYRPASLGGLFADLFPEEYFNVFSSPNRVRQIVSRARRFFEAAGLPLVIEEHGGTYRLSVEGDVGLLVGREARTAEPHLDQIRKLSAVYSEGFTSRQGREALALSPSSFKRLMSWAIEQGIAERVGATTSTYYVLTGVSK